MHAIAGVILRILPIGHVHDEKFARDIKTSRERELPFVGRIKEKLDKEFMGDFPPAKINWFAVFFTCLTTNSLQE